jgi:hypothetical protein
MSSKEIRRKGMDWNQLARDRAQWRASVNMGINSTSIKGWELFDQLSHYQLLRKGFDPWSYSYKPI